MTCRNAIYFRGLPDSTLHAPKSVYQVLKPIEGHHGPAIPWFKQEGMGVQWEFNGS
ncbi:TNT domain-containing protein [Vibrio vulnificus]|nr:TNT domain-containing protein [Vibrio vulnificus]EIC2761551.1 TNT domain-containing protein [Vibrio vulnificus]ELA3114543.1 TNT domain-containing protein [Vibrio vulnificus]EMB7843729.1 TNT domain-containing protein [Vibrio vulnificus]